MAGHLDTDDLSDDAYAIIADAHRTCGLLGAGLAIWFSQN